MRSMSYGVFIHRTDSIYDQKKNPTLILYRKTICALVHDNPNNNELYLI